MSEEGPSLFDQVVAASGLSQVFGAAALRRAIARTGIDPDRAKKEELAAALPEIEKALAVFLRGEELAMRVRRVRVLVA